MLVDYAWSLYSAAGWLHVKLGLLGLMVIYHLFCGKWLQDFKHDRNQHGHVYFRWMNEVPVIFLIAIIWLAVLKPF
jgi:putative membrane protein